MVDGRGASTLRSLIETEIPEGRAGLESSYTNLERVAAYCEANYAQSTDKKSAFDETRRYIVQSLASVAYQVNTLACALLHTLELQEDKITNMATQVHDVGEMIAIHKEKVARREIGVLTVNKCIQKQPKIVSPAVQERTQRYQRTAIDYSVLDGIGHGVKVIEPNSRSFVTRAASAVSSGSTGAHHPVFPNYEQLLPKAIIGATLSRSSMSRGDHYRTPQVASTPVIDPQRFSTVTQGTHYSSIASVSNYSAIRQSRESQLTPLPPPQLASVAQYRLSATSMDGLPPPPSSVLLEDEPLPPPPLPINISPTYESARRTANSNEKSSFVLCSAFDQPYEWIPKVYIEKAVALYDYEAEKPDELTLRENCIVYVLRKNNDGWYEGVLNGCTGLFPGNYVQRID